jgi:glycosyltransferase involved in cell wall biosynthesis
MGDAISIDVQPGFSGQVINGQLIEIDRAIQDSIDVVVLQRPMVDWQLQSIPLFQRAGIAVVVEVDDDFQSLHRLNTVLQTTTPRHRANLVKAAQLADLVTCTTPALAKRYAPHGRFMVLPNYVPAAWLDLDDRERQGDLVGWSGTVATHPNDLQATHGGVGSAIGATQARFRVLGRAELVQPLLRLTEPPELMPWTTIEHYPIELAKLDVGIAPLANTVFNRAKSWLKPLEMAAVGVPVVMSDVGEYRALNDRGIGILASSRRDWHGTVTALLQSADFRAEVSAYGRQAVREGLTIEQNAWKWAEAWSEAVYHRRTTNRKAVAA